MKKFAAVIWLMFAGAAHAEVTQQEMQFCKYMQKEAEAIMGLRQMHADVSELFANFGDQPVYVNMIQAAWNQIPMSLEENKIQQRKEFGNKYFMICYKTASTQKL